MAKSTDNKTAELIARRDRPFTLYYFHAIGENSAGVMEYYMRKITRVKCEYRRGNSRTLDGNISANQNFITVELRDCNVRDFAAPRYESDFCIVCLTSDNGPAANITPETARAAGFNPWSLNQIENVFNPQGRKIQVKILAN